MLTEPIRFPFETPPEEGEAIEVAPGILWIRLPLPMALDHVNIYALRDGDGWTIIDTGFFSKRGRAIWATLMEGPLEGLPIKRIIVTHHHPDHVGAMGWLKETLDVDILMTRTAWLMARMLTLDVQETATPETIRFCIRAGMTGERLTKRREERPFNFADSVAPIPLGFTRITEGSVLKIGERRWDIRIGNGHAPSHLTLWSQDGDVVISGDQVIPGISSNLGVYPTEPDADPVGEWFESCERFLQHATETQLVLPGHKRPFTGLPARLNQLIENHHNAIKRLIPFLSEPRTAVECFDPIFGHQIGEGAWGLAMVEAVGHLNHMMRTGLARRKLREDGAYVFQRI